MRGNATFIGLMIIVAFAVACYLSGFFLYSMLRYAFWH